MKSGLFVLAPLVLLAACGDDKVAAEGERRTAAGEVLGGSITDDMLPLDTVTSQSPPLEASGDAAGGTAGTRAAAPAAETREGPGEPPREPAPAPATTPADEPAAQ